MRKQIWSSGGGVQSAAIAAMIVRGDIAPPDISVIVDTEREASTTWHYMDEVIQPALQSVGVVLHRIKKSGYASFDLYSNNGDLLIPAFTDINGDPGKLPTYCSNEWKQRPMRRWVGKQMPDSQFDVWLGISTDELRRVKQITGKWQNRYPLIERRMSRSDCLSLVERMGWPLPPRSSCWMCPNRGANEWQLLKKQSPSDFQNAVLFEKAIREKDDSLWLRKECEPLDQVVDESNGDLFTGRCDSGYCFT